jgi:hypothetical protein
MIFTGFKRKTNQLFFNKHLKNNITVTSENNTGAIKKVLVLLQDASIKNKVLIDLSSMLNLSENEIEIVVFQKKKNQQNEQMAVFTPKDFGWYGKIKSEMLQTILTKKYDLLINYSKVENIYCNLLLLQCKTNFRVGFAHLNKEFYDLIIKCNYADIELFNSELKKYLAILKKIQ